MTSQLAMQPSSHLSLVSMTHSMTNSKTNSKINSDTLVCTLVGTAVEHRVLVLGVLDSEVEVGHC